MKPGLRLIALSFCLTVLALGCDLTNRLTATKIKDILDHPRNYENIRVVTDRVLPKRGEKLRVTGYMASVEFGSERLVVIREKGGR
ncbi:MAG: hypothetical protein HYY81_08010 [Deltaproteobacteria bacterium]|nr:hypothetical protein [Deltaproteobacteria bacterium]